MSFYFIQLFILLICWLVIEAGIRQQEQKKRSFLLISFLYLFILEGFRSLNFGSDPWYQDLFKDVGRLSWKQVLHFGDYLYYKSEIGYVLLNKSLHTISSDVQILYIFVSLVYLMAMYKYLKRYSVMPLLSVFIFYVVFWFQSFYVLRQYLAIAICLYSVVFVTRRQLKWFILAMILAFTMHQSSIAFAPVYFLYDYVIKLKFKNVALFVAFVVIMILGMRLFMFIAVANTNGYDSYLEGESEGSGNLKMAFVYLTFFICYAVFARKRNETKEENLFFKLLGIAVVLQLAGSQFVLMQRLNLYYAVSLLIVIPNTVAMIKSKVTKYTFLTSTVVLYLYIMYLDFLKDRYSVVPYESILF